MRHDIHRHQGRIDADLTYETRPSAGYPGSYRRIRLIVRRDAKVQVDKRFPLLRFALPGALTLKLQNVWGGDDPEALAAFTTECCYELNVGIVGAAHGSRVVTYGFSRRSGPFGGRHHGTFVFSTYDDRFFCVFSDCASAAEPMKLVTIDKAGRSFVDVTRSRLDLVARDAASLWAEYRNEAAAGHRRTYDVVGVLAPWCADEYRLGKESVCARRLAQAAADGYLSGNKAHSADALIRSVQKRLVAWGYAADPPRLIPWRRIGDIYLGESKTRVDAEYDPAGNGFHVLQRYSDSVQGTYPVRGSSVLVTYTADRVRDIDFITPYYRTRSGFGIGSTIPLGPCHRVAGDPCEHQWRSFVFHRRWKDSRCDCWVKVGLGSKPVTPNGYRFKRHWFFIFTYRGRAAEFYFSANYSD